MKIKNGFVLQQVGNSFLAVAVGDMARKFNSLVKMNGTGAFLWEKMSSDVSVDTLISELISEYSGLEYDKAKEDVLSFVDYLRSNGILDE